MPGAIEWRVIAAAPAATTTTTTTTTTTAAATADDGEHGNEDRKSGELAADRHRASGRWWAISASSQHPTDMRRAVTGR
ncbi:MAG TPA: hypothetical protein VEL07_10300 [Planctomycetota bacterium]|nr:hypothetical protein [Planctomycetota bacterium]